MVYSIQLGVQMSRRPRQFTGQFKFDVVVQLLKGEKTITELCREHQLKDSLVYRWRDELLARGPQVYDNPTGGAGAAEQARIAELERMLGRLTMELEMVKKASSLLPSRSKNGVA
jgi:transposase